MIGGVYTIIYPPFQFKRLGSSEIKPIELLLIKGGVGLLNKKVFHGFFDPLVVPTTTIVSLLRKSQRANYLLGSLTLKSILIIQQRLSCFTALKLSKSLHKQLQFSADKSNFFVICCAIFYF